MKENRILTAVAFFVAGIFAGLALAAILGTLNPNFFK
jgi:uncharacterized protein involved in exopolysaccharide biosynthesis